MFKILFRLILIWYQIVDHKLSIIINTLKLNYRELIINKIMK